MNQTLKTIYNYGVIPIVTVNSVEEARNLALALTRAELPILEITFRTPAAFEALKMLTSEFPDFLAGAGTILTPRQADQAIEAGARFLLAPGFNPRVVDHCLDKGITIVPGINSPTQIELALEKGLKVLKFFPAESSGGIGLIDSMAAPFKDLSFIATGGVRMTNLNQYLASEKILACGGSWIASPGTIAAGDWEKVTEMARKSITRVLGFRLEHLSLPGDPREGNHMTACFPGEEPPGIETGTDGELTYYTHNIPRALHWLKNKGINSTAGTEVEEEGKVISVKLDFTVTGYPVKLVTR